MADVGSINYTNVNQGTVREDRSAEAQAVAQGLAIAKKGINEGIKAKVTGDMLDVIDEAAERSDQGPDLPPDMNAPTYGRSYKDGTREAYLINQLDRFEAKMAQGSRSEQTWAQNQIMAIMNEAQWKYPWLYDELQARAGQVIAGSAELREIGLEDQVRASTATQAQGEYDDLIDMATKDWEDGGLGIPNFNPRDPYHQRLWGERMGKKEQQQSTAVQAAMYLSNIQGDLYRPGAIQGLNQLLTGRESIINDRVQELLIKSGYAEYLAELGKGSRGNVRYIEDFRINKIEQLKRDVRADQAAFKALWTDRVDPGIKEDPQGKRLWERFESIDKFYDDQITLLNGIQSAAPNAEQFLNRAYMIESNDILAAMPDSHARMFNFFTNGPGAKLMELGVAVGNPEMVKLSRRMGLISQSALGDRWPELVEGSHPDFVKYLEGVYALSTEGLQLDGEEDAAGIRQAIRKQFINDGDSFIIPATDEADRQVLALHNMAVHQELFDMAASTLKDADYDFASNALLGTTYSLEYLNSAKEKPGNIHNEVWERIVRGDLDTAIDVAFNDPNPARKMAFGAALGDWYAQTNPYEQRRREGEYLKSERINGIPLYDLVQIDANAINDGKFVMVVNPEQLDLATDQYLASRRIIGTPPAKGSKQYNAAREQVRQDALDAMIPVRNLMEDQIKIERMINKAKGLNKDNLRLEDDWTSFFLGHDDKGTFSIPVEDTWAGQFKFTTGFASRGAGAVNLGGSGEE